MLEQILKLLRRVVHDEEQVEVRRLGERLHRRSRPLLALRDQNRDLDLGQQGSDSLLLRSFHLCLLGCFRTCGESLSILIAIDAN